MAASDRLVHKAADELYGLPPGEFTSARDELAKRLRKDDREAANAVKALRKPTVAAWALNQLARERRKDVDQLLGAGDRLQSAQEKLMAGGDRAAFQKAAATERELVAKLAPEAVSLMRAGGERPGAGLEEKVAATLHAAALDEETADQLRAGRLVREREAIGGFGSFGDAEPAPEPRSRGTSGKARSGGDDAGSSAKARVRSAGTRDSRGRSSDTKRAARAKPSAADTAARERLAGARTDERHARRELDAAAMAVVHAGERADAAAAHAAEAKERAKKTAKRLTEAKQAETAAKKAHTKAAAALQRAESTAAS